MGKIQEEFGVAHQKFEERCPSTIATEAWSPACKAESNRNSRSTADTLQGSFSDGASLMKEFGKDKNGVLTPDDLHKKIEELGSTTEGMIKNGEKINSIQLLALAISQTEDPNLTAVRYDRFLANLRKGI